MDQITNAAASVPSGILRELVQEVITRHISETEVTIMRAAEVSERALLRAWRP
jgi:ferritin-like metal-binding protein YciE